MSSSDIAPSVRMRQLIDGYQLSQAIFVMATLGIPDHLARGPQSAGALADLVSAEPRALYRLLRALASAGILHELDDQAFQLTELGDCLRSDSEEPVGDWARYIGRPYFWEAWDHLLFSVRTGQNAFQKLHGGQRVWEWRAQFPEEDALFNNAMRGLSRQLSQSYLDAFDFGAFPIIADIGGGDGTFLAALLGRYPATRGILFDQPHVVAAADGVLNHANVAHRCLVVGGSFFDFVPGGASAYVLKHILHDWDDEQCLRILQVVRATCGAAPLIALEWVLAPPDAGQRAKFGDLNMLVMPGGQERTMHEWTQLFERGGFRIQSIVESSRGPSVIVAYPAEPSLHQMSQHR